MSFVLNSEAKLSPDQPSESPKLWRPEGRPMVSPAQEKEPVPPRKPAAATGRSKEDLFNFYETMQTAGPVDLSMKDLVEQTTRKRPDHTGPLKKLQDREAKEGGGRLWNPKQRQQQQQHPQLHKVDVPRKANGDQLQDAPRRKSFGEFLEDSAAGSTESLQNYLSNNTHEASAWEEHDEVSPEVTPESSRVALFKRTPSNHHPSRIPPKSPARSPLASPHQQRRASQLACASSPARLGGVERDPSAGWMVPCASPRHAGNAMLAPPSLSREYYRSHVHRSLSTGQSPSPLHPRSEPNDQGLADVIQTKQRTTSPFQRAQSSKHCSTCSSYTLFKTRCLVCGATYCRNCVKNAMGSMPEGRKCRATCVGKPLHRQYASEAGKDKCWPFGLPKIAKKAELKSARRRGTGQSHNKRNHTTNSHRTPSSHGSGSSTPGHRTPPHRSVSSNAPYRTPPRTPPRRSVSSNGPYRTPPRRSVSSNGDYRTPPRRSVSH